MGRGYWPRWLRIIARRSASTAPRTAQPARWSLTSPHACISAYAVVGPTNVKSLRLSSLASAFDSALEDGTSPSRRGAGLRGDRWDQIRRPKEPPPRWSSSAARAFWIVAVIFARLRTTPASDSRRLTSRAATGATAALSKPAKADLKPRRLRRSVSHESPD